MPAPVEDNAVIRLLYERASVRSFEDRPIPAEVMKSLLEAGLHAATGGNLQPYSIIKVENPATRHRLAELCEGQEFIARAPAALIFCLDLHRLKRWAGLEAAPFTADRSFRHFWVSYQDTIICAQSVCTAADALGLGSCYVASILECLPELIDLLHLPGGVFPVVLLSLGYPKAAPRTARKLGVETVVHGEVYRDPGDEELLAAMEAKYPGYRLEATGPRIEEMGRVCREAHGEEFAGRVLARIAEKGYINMAQRYFGLHYQADSMPRDNAEFVRVMAAAGLRPFEEFEPGPGAKDKKRD